MAHPVEVKLPQTAEDAAESLIVFWHRAEGDWVRQGDVLVEVQTEKAVFEIEAPATGRIGKILVKRGEVAAVGDVLAVIEPAEAPSHSGRQTAAATAETTGEAQRTRPAERRAVQASPRVRRLAKEWGIDLFTVTGTGPGGRITEEDVRKAASSPSFPEGGRRALTPVRRTIAKRMVESLQQSAQVTETAWADVTFLSDKRKELAPAIRFSSWVLRAAVLALREHPYMNAIWDEDGIRTFESVHLGVAVDTEEGLLVPVIHRAERLTLAQLDAAVRQAAEQVRKQKLSVSELRGSTFTVTNLGPFGVQFFTPILNPPEAAILGVGSVDSHVVLEGDRPVQRRRLPLSLTFDHRIIDGAPAARFLQTIVRLLAEPEDLL